MQYAAVTTTLTAPTTRTDHAPHSGTPGTSPVVACSAAVRIDSLEKKPASGGTPDSAARPSAISAAVRGSLWRRPPMRPIAAVPTAWITTPAARNSSALKAPWVRRWKTRRRGTPTASAPVM